jgi:hypothetical protein
MKTRDRPIEGPIRRTREGGSEWEPIKILLEGDRNSNKMNTDSNTRLRLTTKVGQAHVATGVPLDLGTNTPPSDPRNARNSEIEHLYSRVWEGNHSPKNHQGFPQISPIKSPRERSRKQPKEITERGLRKSPPRTTGENTSKP